MPAAGPAGAVGLVCGPPVGAEVPVEPMISDAMDAVKYAL